MRSVRAPMLCHSTRGDINLFGAPQGEAAVAAAAAAADVTEFPRQPGRSCDATTIMAKWSRRRLWAVDCVICCGGPAVCSAGAWLGRKLILIFDVSYGLEINLLITSSRGCFFAPVVCGRWMGPAQRDRTYGGPLGAQRLLKPHSSLLKGPRGWGGSH